MIIAQKKQAENIAEYLIYMYQVEDLIRANNFDLQAIEQNIINHFEAAYETKREMIEWYKGLIGRLRSEEKEKSGHMKFLEDIVEKMESLNTKILHEPVNKEFQDAYDKAKKQIDALRMRSGHGRESDSQLALNGLYGLLILKLQKKEISKETEEAFKDISEWMALLTAEYHSKL